MARLPRLTLPGHLHHVIQRGNNRQPIFIDDQDFETMRALLADKARTHGVAVHAYVLMGNHFHLLLTPATQDGLPQLMQALGRRYVQYFNRRHARSGTLWEGRYRGTVLQAGRYLLPCMVYLDLNPVRAGLVAQAADYPWSSHGHWTGLRNDRLLTPHALYWALGNTPFAREAAYANLVQAGIGPQEQAALTASALSGWALGEAPFIADLQKLTPRRIARGQAGRPRKAPEIDSL
ncbi:transposase [Verminephrobacter aporrectodeae subsp. tuberculatae]|uniref:transposase n=1 Tax=Verminephrobacter aporrectodeae TaxID=1110389 RepID=UPI002237C6A8|nr:transposase [Verminephrobacter aporrectodeae]MCW5222105.1 transposase [Verminephrobacter aporrectodeae subsp. tuberculatae]MCW5291396.1 transposase [Verminephrobacter aporrectodeae subsp. tuberculatae]MCW8200198.1 transposase [Verminephrobacter aporrectodeae subsp. tuberculatae]